MYGFSSSRVSVTPETGVCTRTEQVRDKLLELVQENDPTVTQCSQIDLAHLTGIADTLDLRYEQIATLSSGDFNGLTRLRTLRLDNNQLATLPEDIFDGLTELQTLRLNDNKLSSLPEDIFDGLTNLRDLYLSSNRLTTLPEDIFDGLTNLHNLYLSSNRLTTLHEDIFDGLTRMLGLYLSNNRLTNLPEDIFDGLNLRWINISNNRLTTLPEGIFDGLSMYELQLNDNRLTALPEDTFDGLTELHTLSLEKNLLSEAPDITGFISLRTLLLHENPGAPFTYYADLERTNEGGAFNGASPAELKLTFEKGMPFTGDFTFETSAGSVTPRTLGVTTGSEESNTFTLTHTAGATLTITPPTQPKNLNSRFTGLQIKTRGGPDFAFFQSVAANTAPEITAITTTPEVGVDLPITITDTDETDSVTARYKPVDVTTDCTAENFGTGGGNIELTRASSTLTGKLTPNSADGGKFICVEADDGVNDPVYGHSSSTVEEAETPDGGGGGTPPTVTATGVCDRTQKVKEAIVDEVAAQDTTDDIYEPDATGTPTGRTYDTECTKVTATHIADITGTIDLSGQRITTLTADDFSNLTGLTTLDLSNNQIATLQEDIFDDLTNLQSLWLDNNRLTALHADIFDGLTNLRELYLSRNRLATLHEDIFEGLTNLQTLSLVNNLLSEAPDITGLTSLFSLLLQGNPGAPFTYYVDLERTDANGPNFDGASPATLKLTFEQGMPSVGSTFRFGTSHGTVTPRTLSVSRGSEESNTFTLSHTAGATLTITPPTVTSATSRGRGFQVKLRGGPDFAFFQSVAANTAPEITPITETPEVGSELTITITDTDETDSVTARYKPVDSTTDCDADGFGTGGTNIDLTRTSSTLTGTITPTSADGDKHICVEADDGVNDPVYGHSSSIVSVTLETGVCTRTEQVRDKLLELVQENDPTVTQCSQIDLAHLTGIADTLDLRYEQIATLSSGDFNGLTRLRTLRLDNNQIATLPEDIFNELIELQTLRLNDNQFTTTLPEDIFDGLTSLRDLYLNNSRLTTLPEGIFNGLTSLRYLYLESNQLTTLPEDIFDGLGILGLQLNRNRLTTLPEDIFDGLTNLRWINLSNNKLIALPEDIFAGLLILELQLNNNLLSEAPDITGFISLRTLLLHENPGAPFTYYANLERTDTNGPDFDGPSPATLKLTFERGMPFGERPFRLDTSHGTVTPTTLNVAVGSEESSTFTLTHDAGATLTITPPTPTSTSGSGIQVRVRGGPDFAFFQSVATNTAPEITPITTRLEVDEPLIITITDQDGVNDVAARYKLVDSTGDCTFDNFRTGGTNIDLTETSGTITGTITPNSVDVGKYICVEADDGVNDPVYGYSSSMVIEYPAVSVCDRTQKVKEAIVDKVAAQSLTDSIHKPGAAGSPTEATYDTECTEVTATHLADITGTLDLSSQRITTLENGDFNGLANLQNLWLNDNQLTTLHEDIFDGLTNLRTLYLSENRLTTLPEDIFDDLTNLWGLQLNSNQLSEAPDITGLISISTLLLQGNPGAPFTYYAGLKRIDANGPNFDGASPATLHLTLEKGMPFGGRFTLTESAGILSTSTLSVTVGSEESGTFTLSHTDDVTLTITPPTVPHAFNGLQIELRRGPAFNFFRSATVNTAPVFDITGLTAAQKTATVGEEYTLDVKTIVEDDATADDALTIGLESDITGMDIPNNDGVITWTPTSAQVGEHDIEVRATDEGSLSTDQTITVTVVAATPSGGGGGGTPTNEAPVFDITTLTTAQKTATVGVEYTLDVKTIVSDDATADDALTIGLESDITGMDIPNDDGVITWTPTSDQVGEHDIEIRATDEGSLSTDQSIEITVTLPALTTGVCERTEKVRDAIVDLVAAQDKNDDIYEPEAAGSPPEATYTTECVEVKATHLAAITTDALDLQNSEITTLLSDDFEGLINLQNLYLNTNQIATLPEGIFDGLTSLRILWLFENQLSEAPDITGLTSLAFLALNDNPGATFTYYADLERTNGEFSETGDATLKLTFEKGMPFSTGAQASRKFRLSTSHGTVTPDTLSVTAGSEESGEFTLSHTGVGATLTITTPNLPSRGFPGLQLKLKGGPEFALFESVATNTAPEIIPITETPEVGEDLPITIVDPDGVNDVSARYKPVDATADCDAENFGEGGKHIDLEVDAEATTPGTLTRDITPDPADEGKHICVEADDGIRDPVYGYSSSTVQAETTNTKPVFDITTLTTAQKTATVGVEYTLDVKTIVSDDATADDDLTITLTSTITGMTIPNGVITWTPTSAQVGEHDIEVRATDEGGLSEDQTIEVTVVATTPAKPTNLRAEKGPAAGEIVLTWTAPTDTGGSDITGYRIEQSTDSGTNWSVLVEDTAKTETTYKHTGLGNGETVRYRVYAINDQGESAEHSNEKEATTNTAPTLENITPKTATVGTELTFTAVGEDTDEPTQTLTYSLGGDDIGATIGESSGDFTWTPAREDAGEEYTITVIVSDGIVSTEQEVTITVEAVKPGAPTNLRATGGDKQIVLTWTAPTDTGGEDITGYRIEQSADGSTNWSYLPITVTTTTYTHTGLESSETLHYRVYAINSKGQSAASNIHSAITNNEAPVFDITTLTAAETTAAVGVEYTLDVKTIVSDDATADDDLTITLTSTIANMEIDTNDVITWTPTEAQVGEHTIELTATDEGGALTEQDIIVEVVAATSSGGGGGGTPANTKPVFDITTLTAAETTAAVGVEYTLDVKTIVSDDATADDDLTITLTSTIANMEIDTNDVITWTPTEAQVGEHTIELTATDEGGLFTDQSITVTVTLPALTTGVCERTEEVRDKLLELVQADHPTITLCSEVTATHLDGITGTLDLSNETITALSLGDFEGLINLQTLWIDNNQFATLPEDIFDGLTNLQTLWVNDNQITTLPEDIFDGLTNLVTLLLHNNQFTTLPEDIFDGLTNLQTLYLYDNDQLTTLPEDIFDGLTNLQTLWMHDNDQLTTLPEDIFDGLVSLQTLSLNGNELTEAPDVTGLTSLSALTLQENPGAPFTYYANLERTDTTEDDDFSAKSDAILKLTFEKGMPFTEDFGLASTGGDVTPTTLSVTVGSEESSTFTLEYTGSATLTITPPETPSSRGYQVQLKGGPAFDFFESFDDNDEPSINPITETPEVGEGFDITITDTDGVNDVSASYKPLDEGEDCNAENFGEEGGTHIELDDETGTIMGTIIPDPADEGKRLCIEIDDGVNDPVYTSSPTVQAAATPGGGGGGTPTNEAPVFDITTLTTAQKTATVGVEYTLDVKTIVSDDATTDENLTITLTSTITGMDIPNDDGVITWTPTRDQVGEHTIEVRATDEGGLPADQTIEVTVVATTPAKPTNLRAEKGPAAGEIVLTWTAPTDTGGSDITGYRIEQSTDSGTNWSVLVEDTAKTETTYKHTGLGNGETVRYRVYAINDQGESAEHSNEKEATTNTAPTLENITPKTATVGTELTFTAVGEDTDEPTQTLTYSLGGDDIGATIGESSGDFTWTPAREDAGEEYTITVIVSDGIVSTEQEVTITVEAVKPGAPTNLRATGGDKQIVLTWTAPTDTGGEDITGYRIEQSADGSTNWSYLPITVTTTTYTHTGLESSQTVHYRVYAINSKGQSAASNIHSAITNNAAPVFDITAVARTATVGEEYRLDVRTIVEDDATTDDALTIGLESTIANMEIDTNDVITWTPTEAQVGEHTIELTATDEGGLSADQTIVVTVEAATPSGGGGGGTPANTKPVFDITTLTAAETTAAVGVEYTLDVKEIVEDDATADDDLTITLESDITGMTIPNGVITWTPTEAQVGEHTIEVRATDEGGLSEDQSIDIEVVATSVCDRTEKVRNAIVDIVAAQDAEDNIRRPGAPGTPGNTTYAKECEKVEATHLADTTFILLDLSGQEITTLLVGDFVGLTNLETLYLNNNQLTALPEDIFDGLTNLRELWLSNNRLATLPEDIFDGLTNLQTLHLDSNPLTTLPEDVFDGLTNLRYLYLNDNKQLTTLPEDIFDGLTNLRELWLNDNNFATFPENVFDGLTNLHTLWLYENRLSEAPDITGLTSLSTLSLQGNPGETFTYYANLERIDTPNGPEFDGASPATLKLTFEKGMPFTGDFTLSSVGNLSTTTLNVTVGSEESSTFTLEHTHGAALTITLPRAPRNRGFQIKLRGGPDFAFFQNVAGNTAPTITPITETPVVGTGLPITIIDTGGARDVTARYKPVASENDCNIDNFGEGGTHIDLDIDLGSSNSRDTRWNNQANQCR